jgi:uncharacterized protein (DUF2225 family)
MKSQGDIIIEKSFTCPICNYTFKKIDGQWLVFDSDGKFHSKSTTDESFEKNECPLHGLIKER